MDKNQRHSIFQKIFLGNLGILYLHKWIVVNFLFVCENNMQVQLDLASLIAMI